MQYQFKLLIFITRLCRKKKLHIRRIKFNMDFSNSVYAPERKRESDKRCLAHERVTTFVCEPFPM